MRIFLQSNFFFMMFKNALSMFAQTLVFYSLNFRYSAKLVMLFLQVKKHFCVSIFRQIAELMLLNTMRLNDNRSFKSATVQKEKIISRDCSMLKIRIYGISNAVNFVTLFFLYHASIQVDINVFSPGSSIF